MTDEHHDIRAWAQSSQGSIDTVTDIGVNAHSIKAGWYERAAAAGVSRFLLTGCHLRGSQRGQQLCIAAGANGLVKLQYTAGVHPHDSQTWTPDVERSIATLIAHEHCGAVGETGLDYDRMRAPMEVQQACFAAQCRLAVAAAKPLFLHCRDRDHGPPLGAYDDLLRILSSSGADLTRCCLHCFTGDEGTLRRMLDAGLKIGVTGFICKKERGEALRSALISLAAEHGGEVLARCLLLETDAPYMRPPDALLKGAFRKGRDSEPAMTVAVCRTVAECLGVSATWLARATTEHAHEFFGFKAHTPLSTPLAAAGVEDAVPTSDISDATTSATNLTMPSAPAPLQPTRAPLVCPLRPRRFVTAFDGSTWVAADWHEATAPRSFSGFFLPLIFSGLSPADVATIHSLTPGKHYGTHRAATPADLAAVQSFWSSVFSHWVQWVDLVRCASNDNRLSSFLQEGDSARCSSLLPMRLPGVDEPWAFGAVPHIKPRAQNGILEDALGQLETARFYASVACLFGTGA